MRNGISLPFLPSEQQYHFSLHHIPGGKSSPSAILIQHPPSTLWMGSDGNLGDKMFCSLICQQLSWGGTFQGMSMCMLIGNNMVLLLYCALLIIFTLYDYQRKVVIMMRTRSINVCNFVLICTFSIIEQLFSNISNSQYLVCCNFVIHTDCLEKIELSIAPSLMKM